MHDKMYHHPTPYRPKKDLAKHMYEVHILIEEMTKRDQIHPDHAVELGGLASYHDHLHELQYGHAHMIKKELVRVMDYLYQYAMTGHNIYKFLAEDAFKHVEQLHRDITDKEEEAHVEYFLEEVKEYMSWLKPILPTTTTTARPMVPPM